MFLSRQKGLQNLKSYNGGTSTQWEEWRFGVMTWIQQEYPKIADIAIKLEGLDAEPEEPKEEANAYLGDDPFTPDDEWGSEQPWALLVAKATGPAHTMIVNLGNSPKSRGVRAWYKLMCDAKGTRTTQIHEVTERLHPSDRKQVHAKAAVSTFEAFDNETRKYIEVTGKSVDDAFKVLTLQMLLPDKIWEMLHTTEQFSYQECTDYAIKQARVIKQTTKRQRTQPQVDQP